jgi:hypothetical protein
LLLPLVAALAVLLVACGGGDDGDENEPSPTATTSAAGEPQPTAAPASPAAGSPTVEATVEDRTEIETLLKAAALQLEDLPSGYTLDDETFSTNEESAEDESELLGGPTLEDLNRFGRILGYDASYSQEAGLSSILEGGTLSLQVTTTLYEDSDGADEAFEFVREQASDPEFVDAFEESFASTPGVEVQDASLTPLSFAELGDERLAFEFKVSAHSTDLDQDFDFIARLVGIRRDRLIGSVTILAVNESPSQDELEDLGRTLDERMNDALE